jgi:hypothetical protein
MTFLPMAKKLFKAAFGHWKRKKRRKEGQESRNSRFGDAITPTYAQGFGPKLWTAIQSLNHQSLKHRISKKPLQPSPLASVFNAITKSPITQSQIIP